MGPADAAIRHCRDELELQDNTVALQAVLLRGKELMAIPKSKVTMTGDTVDPPRNPTRYRNL